MSLVPAFELGVWSAWIFILPQILIIIISQMILGKRETFESAEELTQHTEMEKKVSKISWLMIIGSWIYSIFLPLKSDTAWFYAGCLLYLLGIIFYIMSNLAFTSTPIEKPVTKSVYRISRHPINFGLFLMLVGIGIACASWIFLLCGILFMILMHFFWLPSEERWCLEKYGDAYREYMNRTPRWIGFPKSKKQ
jgi:protein-S-isoprenylcysteine O-methyltransferase Ste14